MIYIDILLPISSGETVAVFSTWGDEDGWWLGGSGRNTGYFPKIFVERTNSVLLTDSRIFYFLFFHFFSFTKNSSKPQKSFVAKIQRHFRAKEAATQNKL
jgi:hypothetical protein